MELKFNCIRDWLDYLFYEIGRQRKLEICGLYKNGDNRKSSKWINYLDIVSGIESEDDIPNLYNQRSVLAHEVILDLENKDEYKSIIQTLKKEDLYFMAWFSGSRGYHISLFFDRDLEEIEKMRIIDIFNCDLSKAIGRTMIAMEFKNHWKTGNPKTLVENNLYDEQGNIGSNKLTIETKPASNGKNMEIFKIEKSNKILGYT